MLNSKYLFKKFVDYANLLSAFDKAFKTDRSSDSIYYRLELSKNIYELHEKLNSGLWLPHEYTYFIISRPKVREISKANFEDRIVHHAYISVIEPYYERDVFSPFSFASRIDRGVHKAVLQAHEFFCANKYFLKTDIHHFFPSIDHEVLKAILSRHLADTKIHRLENLIIDNALRDREYDLFYRSHGLPIGNLTSQFWANVYLNELDEFITSKGFSFVRYMDDTIIFSPGKESLRSFLKEMREFLKEKLFLELKETATLISDNDNPLPFLGISIRKDSLTIRSENYKRAMKNLKRTLYAYEKGKVSDAHLSSSLSSYNSYLWFDIENSPYAKLLNKALHKVRMI